MHRGLNPLRLWLECQSGNAFIAFTLSLPVLAGSAGLAVDFSRAQSARQTAQATLDAAMLAASRATTIEDDKIAETITNFFARADARKFNGAVTDIVGKRQSDSKLTGRVTLTVETTLMKVIGHKKMVMPLVTSIEKGLGNVEIALVLDSTKSMDGAKLGNLKTAALQLIDEVYALPNATDKVKFSLVPFAQYVNVGMAHRNASWMDVPADYAMTKEQCGKTYPNATSSNCRTETYTYLDDGVPVSYTGQVCDWDLGEPVTQCNDVTYSYTWKGCAGARDGGLNIQDKDYNVRIPGLLNINCPSEILPLTKDPARIRDSINDMFAQGETFIPTGLTWGWRVLSNRAPFTESADDPSTASGQVRKYLVLMTDGQNTKSARFPERDHEGTDVAASNQATINACRNIRADTASKIEIFTIAFAVTDETIKSILRDECATPGGAFFDAVDYSKLMSAFDAIGKSISIARISK